MPAANRAGEPRGGVGIGVGGSGRGCAASSLAPLPAEAGGEARTCLKEVAALASSFPLEVACELPDPPELDSDTMLLMDWIWSIKSSEVLIVWSMTSRFEAFGEWGELLGSLARARAPCGDALRGGFPTSRLGRGVLALQSAAGSFLGGVHAGDAAPERPVDPAGPATPASAGSAPEDGVSEEMLLPLTAASVTVSDVFSRIFSWALCPLIEADSSRMRETGAPTSSSSSASAGPACPPLPRSQSAFIRAAVFFPMPGTRASCKAASAPFSTLTARSPNAATMFRARTGPQPFNVACRCSSSAAEAEAAAAAGPSPAPPGGGGEAGRGVRASQPEPPGLPPPWLALRGGRAGAAGPASACVRPQRGRGGVARARRREGMGGARGPGTGWGACSPDCGRAAPPPGGQLAPLGHPAPQRPRV